MWNLKIKTETDAQIEQTDGNQKGRYCWGWVRKVKGIRSTNWQLQNSHRI